MFCKVLLNLQKNFAKYVEVRVLEKRSSNISPYHLFNKLLK